MNIHLIPVPNQQRTDKKQRPSAADCAAEGSLVSVIIRITDSRDYFQMSKSILATSSYLSTKLKFTPSLT